MKKNRIVWTLVITLKALIIVTLISSCIGCNNNSKIALDKDVVLDPTLNQYVEAVINLFPYDAPFRVPRVALKADLTYTRCIGTGEDKECTDKPAVGVCRSLNNGQPIEILLDQDKWEEYDDLKRLSLLAHEISHCAGGLGHTKGGLMDPFIHNTVAEVVEYGLEEAMARAWSEVHEAL